MPQEPDDTSGETLKHAFIVALLTFAAAVVENFRDSPWVARVGDTWLRCGVVIGVTAASFTVVLFIGRRLDRNRRLAQQILDRQPMQSAAGPLDGLWIDAVWNGQTLVGGSIFSIRSSRAEGFRLNGEFYKLVDRKLRQEPTGWFNGVGQKIDESGFVYRFQGGEHGPVRPEDHTGTGYYYFHGRPGWEMQTFHGHFAIASSLEVRIVRGERRSADPDAEIRTTQSHQWLYLGPFMSPPQAGNAT